MKKQKRINWKVLIVSLVIVYLIAWIGSVFTSGNVNSEWYSSVKPEITPANWVFPVVWNILFFMIALSIYFSWISAKNKNTKKSIAILFGINLLFNLLWSYLFFGLQNAEAAFIDLILIWTSIISLLVLTWRIDKKATWLLVPYLLWVSFAGILNWMIAF